MGVTVETKQPGDNKTFPKPGDTVTMDYTGKFLDGTVRISGQRINCEHGYSGLQQQSVALLTFASGP